MVEKRNAYRILMGKPEGKRSPGKIILESKFNSLGERGLDEFVTGYGGGGGYGINFGLHKMRGIS
jgi:hypothetical protein